MIPTSFPGALSLPSPQQTERDLARLIHRTVEMAMSAKRELGYAAVNTGCDGIERATMFDGSSCQTSGDVCLATREEGITVCIDRPAGSGLAFQRIAFAAPACEPVTGWWIVDAEGYMYKVPDALVTAAAYWPMSVDPMPETLVTLVRAGTWARLMCGSSLVVPLNGDGGAEWAVLLGESDWSQLFNAAIGGIRSQWTVLPSLGISVGGSYAEVTIEDGEGILDGTAFLTGSAGHFLYPNDGEGAPLTVGHEYPVTFCYTDGTGIESISGAQALIGETVSPTVPDGSLPIGTCLIKYGLVGSTVTLTASLDDRFRLAVIPPNSFVLDGPGHRGILLRDSLAPNAGFRVASVTLPAGGTGIVTGAVNVAYGYPFGYEMRGLVGVPASLKPYPRPNVVGAWQADCIGRTPGDMALVYRKCLAVEYGPGHIALDGDAITDPNDYVDLDEIDESSGPALDARVGVIGLPGAEVVFLGENGGDTRIGKRYRVRPAPANPLTVTLSQEAKGAWPTDPNLWTEETSYTVAAWGAGVSSFTVNGSALATFPGRAVACMLWETDDPVADAYPTAAVQYPCTLGETVAGVTTLECDTPVSASSKAYRYLTIIGPHAHAAWGWTEEKDGHESAMSPLTDQGVYGYRLDAPAVLYSVALTVPAGSAGADRRHVYRFAYDAGSKQAGEAGPWSYAGESGGLIGGLYDRMCRRIATIEGNVEETVFDEDLSFAMAGTRPPSPLIYLGPLAIDAPRPVHVLQPMEL